MYSPDRVFLNDLKHLDPRLGCYYETNHQHFVITYDRAVGGSVPIMVVEDGKGGFRYPDKRELDKLMEFDTHRVSMAQRLKHSAAYMEEVREKKRKDAREAIRDHTKDDRRQLAPKFARLTGGKFNSTFRRINLKRRGKTVDELQKAINN
jgi:hypothetical protein